MATSLEKLENEVQIHHLHLQRFHMVKRLRKSVQYVRRYSTKCASFFGRVMCDVHKYAKPCQLWSYWTEFHKILTRFRGIIYAVNAHIEIAIAHSVSEWQSNKCKGVGNFAPFCHQIGCHGNVPSGIGKTGLDQENSRKYLLHVFGEKIVKISPVDIEIALLIVKKNEKKKKLTQAKYISLPASLLSGLNDLSEN